MNAAKAVAVGMFDGMHLGHRHMIRRLAEIAGQRNLQATAITFAEHPLAAITPGHEPKRLSTNALRQAILKAEGAREVVETDFASLRHLTGREFLQHLADDGVCCLLMGFNNHIGCDRLDAAGAAALGIVEIIHDTPPCDIAHISSTAVRNALGNGEIEAANAMLGRPYRLTGTVVHGKRLGRTIGFPTANISTEPHMAIPAPGVYAVDVRIGNESIWHSAMANIGHRPTVDTAPGAPLSIEINIFDFDADIYGSTIEAAFLSRLRSEHTFPDLDSLARALDADRRAALSLPKTKLYE